MLINGAMNPRLTEFAAQGDAALAALFRAFHAAAQRANLGDQFRRYRAAAFAGYFPAIKRHAEVGAAGTAVQTRIRFRRIIGRCGSAPDRRGAQWLGLDSGRRGDTARSQVGPALITTVEACKCKRSAGVGHDGVTCLECGHGPRTNSISGAQCGVQII